jgi:glycosyltransferase involved in cell wall biosynthesis
LTERDQNGVGEAEKGDRLRMLVFAYACEPQRGGEPEAGWIWSRMLARIGETWVMTRTNNREVIESHMEDLPERENIRFVYVDLPPWARFWKRRDKGARLYYLLWQVAALSRAMKLRRQVGFDVVWHLTWANAWIGSLAAFFALPFVYGPVGGGVGMDWRFISVLGIRGTFYEIARSIARYLARYANPLARLAWRRARLILVQNPETRSWLPRRHRAKAIVFPNVVIDRASPPEVAPPRRPPTTAIYVGRLVPLKGLALALRVLTLLPEWRLIICGTGPDERRLKRMARRLRVEDRVEFHGSIPKSEVGSFMRRADVFLFPSLHDEGGFVVAEALAEGLPVVCLDRGGPPVIGGRAVTPGGASETVAALAAAMSEAAGTHGFRFPGMSSRTEELRRILAERLRPDTLRRTRLTLSPTFDVRRSGAPS